MKSILFIVLSVVISVAQPDMAFAEIVSYIDDNGKVHYVNTEYSKVPEKYLYQIEGQVEQEEASEGEKTTATETVEAGAPAQTAAPVQENLAFPFPQPTKPLTTLPELSKSVEFYTSASCAQCVFVEAFLKSQNIAYDKYDATDGRVGQERFRGIGGSVIPTTKVGGVVIQGTDTSKIAEALRTLPSQ